MIITSHTVNASSSIATCDHSEGRNMCNAMPNWVDKVNGMCTEWGMIINLYYSISFELLMRPLAVCGRGEGRHIHIQFAH